MFGLEELKGLTREGKIVFVDTVFNETMMWVRKARKEIKEDFDKEIAEKQREIDEELRKNAVKIKAYEAVLTNNKKRKEAVLKKVIIISSDDEDEDEVEEVSRYLTRSKTGYKLHKPHLCQTCCQKENHWPQCLRKHTDVRCPSCKVLYVKAKKTKKVKQVIKDSQLPKPSSPKPTASDEETVVYSPPYIPSSPTYSPTSPLYKGTGPNYACMKCIYACNCNE